MSARPVNSTIAPLSAIMIPSTVMQFSPVVPTSQSHTYASHAYQNTASAEPTVYPPPADIEVVHTNISYHNEPIPELIQNDRGTWTLRLSVPIPDLITPTLKTLVYMIKYSTTYDSGNSTVQADIVLTTTPCLVGIIAGSADQSIYRTGSEYGPQMIDNDSALCLSVVPAVKCNGGSAQWSHYIDHNHLFPNVRIVDPSSLYLNFHVAEYPTAQTLRYLAIEVSASWTEDKEEKERREEEKRKAAQMQVESAPQEADPEIIEEAMKRNPDSQCANGLGWVKKDWGYQCTGGGHKLTWEQLKMV